jgi:hypothetical protein
MRKASGWVMMFQFQGQVPCSLTTAGQVQAAGHEGHGQHREQQGDFIGHGLRHRAGRAEQAVFVVGGPAAQKQRKHRQAGEGQNQQQAEVDVHGVQAIAQGQGQKEQQNRQERQHRRQPEEDGVGVVGHEELLAHQLEGVGQGLQKAVGADLVGAGPALHVAGHLALHPDHHQTDEADA